jgi:hypothetical protein
MELVVTVTQEQTLAAALEAGVGAVSAPLPRWPKTGWDAAMRQWRQAAGERGVKFYLSWEWPVARQDWPQALELLNAAAGMEPEALALRDLGIMRQAQARFPKLPLWAAGSWGGHNSPGLRLAQRLGFSRAAVAGPVSLKDLALMRRQCPLPLEVALPAAPWCYPHLCLLPEHAGLDCTACQARFGREADTLGHLRRGLELFAGLCQLQVDAVHLGRDLTDAAKLRRVVEVYQTVRQAAAAHRPGVLAAAAQVLAAMLSDDAPEPPPPPDTPGPRPSSRTGRRELYLPQGYEPGRGQVWLEVRDYQEAAALGGAWRDLLLLELTPQNYSAFLADHRRWSPRRLAWRLPGIIPESSLAFFQKALETLHTGHYRHFVAGDWSGAALIKALGGEALADLPLGLRNHEAGQAARPLGVSRACLSPEEARSGGFEAEPDFWAYLSHFPALMVCRPPDKRLYPEILGPHGEPRRWRRMGELLALHEKTPRQCPAFRGNQPPAWLRPLVLSLTHSGLPWGQAPQPPPKPAPRRPSGKKPRRIAG